MALMDFIKKQFIDVIQWTESGDDVLAWRFPMAEMEIQNGASLTVRESQQALFVNEGTVADLFGPGQYTLTTRTLPVLTYLKNWDKLFESPFKSDVYFFSTRQRIDRRWGTPQPVTVRDKDFGAVRIRAFGNYAFHVADPKIFHTTISGTRDRYEVGELEGQLKGLIVQGIANGIASSGVPFLDLAANQTAFAGAIGMALAPEFDKLGLKLDGFTLQSVSLPDELQKVLDQKIGMGMVGDDLNRFIQYQTGQAIPTLAQGAAAGGGSGVVGDAVGLGAGVAMGQVLAQTLQQGMQPARAAQPAQPATAAQAVAGGGNDTAGQPSPTVVVGLKPDEVAGALEKLHELLTKGILTQAEFDAKKTELLKKLV
ncbi:MAG: SPFH domain-containing protein [Burkholderiaceae bacterium]